MSFRRPIGVAGIITPFNFPLAIPTWKMFPALLCGNACIFKPAEDVPHTGHVLVEIMLEAGLPPEVIQLVHGLGEDVGAAIVEPSRAFRSSRSPARPRRAASSARRAAACTSGCRSRWAARTRDRAWTTPISISRSRACCGARSARRASAARRRAGSSSRTGFTTTSSAMLVDRARALQARRRPEEGHRRRSAHPRGVAREGRALRRHRAGRRRRPPLRRPAARRARGSSNGFFFEPTIFARVEPGMRLEQEEIFGPVLSRDPRRRRRTRRSRSTTT